MLYLIQSNQMEALSKQLAAELATPISEMPLLMSEQILVQSPGMSTWLRLEIAKHNGIAAGIDFPLPSSFIWQLCHTLLTDVSKDNAFTKPAMTWKLMQLLPDLLHLDEFATLKHYLADEAPLKLYQLCGRIADIYDQYLVYRPDWILGWEANEQPLVLEDAQQWQPILWRSLIKYNDLLNNNTQGQAEANPFLEPGLKSNASYHRANLHQALFDALDNSATCLDKLPKRLFVFGISSMAPQTLEVLYYLAKRIDVMILSLSPCQHYWGDIIDVKLRARMAMAYTERKQLATSWEDKLEVGNPILASNGKMGRELLDLMLALPDAHLDFTHDHFITPPQNTMLGGIQTDILELQTRGEIMGPDAKFYQNIIGKRVVQTSDDSITIRSCHSPLREIETFHDHLLDMLSRDTTLTPKDIVVMLPDVAAYAPYIDAVFSSKQGLHYIPYAIADRGAAQESPLITSFLHLLSLDQSRFGLTEVISILEVPALLRRFNLDDDELQLIRHWLEIAAVRWGRDQSSREEQALPSFIENSWAFGIKRMILGYAFEDNAGLYQTTLPVEGIEGHAAQALGKLLNFIEALDEHRLTLVHDAVIDVRIQQLESLLENFYLVDDEEREQLQEIRQGMSKLQQEITQASLTEPLNIQVLQSWFNAHLSESRVGQRYLAGSVNFCTLMPMRSIPFKLVCLLGMNDGDYPRVQQPVGFDLIAHNGPRKGDRSRRLDDRYLFLEALLSAREQLYISYIGHSERDNSERIPSMLISELIEQCQISFLPEHLEQQAEALQHLISQELTRKTVNKDTLADRQQEMRDLLGQIDKDIVTQLVIEQPLQPFDARLYQSTAPQVIRIQHSYAQQWCPAPSSSQMSKPSEGVSPSNEALTGNAVANIAPQEKLKGRFICRPLTQSGSTEQQTTLTDSPAQIELSALVRFYRNPAQYFFNRCLKLDLSVNIQRDDNDEPFTLNPLERYKMQAVMLADAIKHQTPLPADSLLEQLKASGNLPLQPFNDLLLDEYLHDIAPLIDRTLYLLGEQVTSIDVDLNFAGQPTASRQTHQLIGRLDDVSAKGLISYRPGTANGRDLVRNFIRHLALNAAGVAKPSYLLDVGHFYAYAPIEVAQANQQLQQWLNYFDSGQDMPLCFMPKTAFAYVEADGDHWQKLAAAQSQWLDEQSNLGEGIEPHYRRLFVFPEDFVDQTEHSNSFSHIAQTLLAPLVSLLHKGKLAELQSYVEQGQ